jgi:hypothetical protein
VVTSLVGAVLPVLPIAAGTASAGGNPGYTLEGCRQDGQTFPINGPFICDNADYTTGNLGDWAELDLVPHRVTVSNISAGSVTLGLGGDHKYNSADSYVGWDYISVPVLNTSLSGSGCDSTPTASALTYPLGSNGGAYDTIQRNITLDFASAPSGVCVYDYYQRLALGSAQYSGSSLQSYVNSSFSGEKRVSLPVPERAQLLDKDMSASQGSDYTWNVTKETSPASLTFNDTCSSTSGSSDTVDITIRWTRNAATPSGDITVTSNVYATNPAGRPLQVEVSDLISWTLNGVVQTQTVHIGPTTIAANGTSLIGTITLTIPAGATNIHDTATGTYIDPVVPQNEVPIAATLSDTASATVQNNGPVTNSTATISDTESITGPFTFSVATPATGSFTGGYVAGTHTTGPVGWSSGSVSGSGSVVFHKTVYAGYGTSGSGSLSDTATLTASDGFTTSAQAAVPVSSSVLRSITVTKTAPNFFQGSDTASFVLHLATGTTYSAANDVATHTFTFNRATPVDPNTGRPTLSYTFSGLTGAQYVLHESNATGWAPQADQPVSFTGTGASNCAAARTYNNTPGVAVAQASKVTFPAGNEAGWAFTLTRNGVTYASGVTDANGVLRFEDNDPNTNPNPATLTLDEGSYVFTEDLTTKPGWDQTGATGCTFTVNYPADNDRTFTCTFTNTQRGHIVVYKHTDPAGDTQGFVFTPSYNGGATFTLHDGESNDSGALVPGSYSVSEAMPTGWQADPNHATTCSDGTSSYAASAITLGAGKTVTCHFYNQKKGRAQVVKTFNGSALSGTDSFTFQLRSGATPTAAGTVLESATTNAGNGGTVTFSTYLTPGSTYQLCETGLLPNWHTTLENVSGYFAPGPVPVDNSTICVNFTVGAGETKVFTVDNTNPGGDARTIGFWKNWTSCDGRGRQAHVLDQTLALAQPGGIAVGSLVLHGDVNNPNTAPSCLAAIRILNKSRVDTGAKAASDPVFAFASQYLAAKLNYVAGAKHCSAATSAMTSGQSLLLAVHFNGSTHDPLTSTQKSQLLTWANTLDQYNNNPLC